MLALADGAAAAGTGLALVVALALVLGRYAAGGGAQDSDHRKRVRLLGSHAPALGGWRRIVAKTLADDSEAHLTPDLLPSDVTGAPFYDQRTADMVFRPGPVFTHLLLADEINRTPPKTQAALLEAMAESQVSVDGSTRPLPDPFVVVATANPIEYEGTYTLPEAQLDRFLLRVRMGYLTAAQETGMLRARLDRAAPEAVVRRLSGPGGVLAMRAAVERVEVDDDLLEYVVALVGATRDHPHIQVGASPRGGLALVQLARARAVLDLRDYATPEDVKSVAVPALAHRVTLKPELWVRQIDGDDVIREIVQSVAAPQTLPSTPAVS
ncbi:MoxR family ATPase [Streptomyces lavendulae]|nr:MoxR family ATPase [Streptomyces lavendulae]